MAWNIISGSAMKIKVLLMLVKYISWKKYIDVSALKRAMREEGCLAYSLLCFKGKKKKQRCLQSYKEKLYKRQSKVIVEIED